METEIWKSNPNIHGIEVSSFGRVRVLDRVVSTEKMTRFVKGHVLKQCEDNKGYLRVGIKINSKWTKKSVHRLVAQTFISNPDNLPEVNHKDCNKTNNSTDNLEWCTHEENIAYRDKCGHTARNNAPKSPVFSLNLKTLEVSNFCSQSEASRELGVDVGSINHVIKGKRNHTGGFWFVNDDNSTVDAVRQKLNELGKTGLKAKDEESAKLISQVAH